jgi:hypothetical protein
MKSEPNWKEKIEKEIREEIEKLINKSAEELDELIERHKKKRAHFMPVYLRVLGGYLQSLNIRYGGFIEKEIERVIRILSDYGRTNFDVDSEYSGEKLTLMLEENSRKAIDDYVSEGKIKHKASEQEFSELLDTIFRYQTSLEGKFESRKLDVNLLMRDRDSNRYYYIEVKYCDDHDTGKFVSINRKFLYTFAGLIHELWIHGKIHSKDNIKDNIVPILYYFEDGLKKYENVFLIEGTNVLRGKQLFELFGVPEAYDVIISALDPKNYEDKIKKTIEDKVKRTVGNLIGYSLFS